MKHSLTLLLDEGAPRQVAEPFKSNGHRVIYHQEILAQGATDELVVSMSLVNKAVLIAIDNDMKRMVRRFGKALEKPTYPHLNLISVNCNEVLAAKRVEQAMTLIENEWTYCSSKAARRMWVDIWPHKLITYR